MESEDEYGRTPLWWAIEDGSKEIIQRLLDKGIDIKSKDSLSQTPLSWAIKTKSKDITQLLLDKGADVESKDMFGRTPLLWAIQTKSKDITQLLLDRGVDIESKDNLSRTPLLWAVENRRKEIVQLLLDKGANIESEDSLSRTPLSWAIENRSKEIVQLLLDKGAKPKKYVNVASNINSQLGSHSHSHKTILVQPNSNPGYATLEKDASKTVQTTMEGLKAFPNKLSHLTDKSTNDAATIYSSTSSLNNWDGDFIIGLTRILLHGADSKSANAQVRDRVSGILPRLLKSFAERLASEPSSKVHREAATLIRKARYKISAHFAQQIMNQPQALAHGKSDAEDSSEDEETSSSSISKHLPEITISERVRKWQESIPGSIDYEAPDPNKPCNECEIGEETDEFVNEDPKDPNKQKLRDYEEIILASHAHSWLLSNLKKEIGLIQVDPSVMNHIRNVILSGLPLPRRISRANAIRNFSVTFEVDWDPLNYLTRQFDGSGPDMLGSTLTLTGSFKDAQAITCLNYMQQTWPLSGEHTVKLLHKVLLNPGEWVESKLPDDTTLIAQMSESKLMAVVIGNRDAIAEIGEQLAWISAALRMVPNDQGVHGSTPSIQKIPTEDHLANLPRSLQSVEANYSVTCNISSPTIRSHSTGQCWHALFKNPVVVQGYPILRRPREKTGLEIPLDILAALVQAQQITAFGEGLYIKGFSSVLVFMDRAEDSIIWHLNYNPDGSYISYPDAPASYNAEDTDLEHIIKCRHIVGWHASAKFYTGTDKALYPVEKPALETVNDQCILHGIKPPQIKAIEKRHNYNKADKEKPIHIHHGYQLHRRRLERLKDQYVNLWDVESKRGWLVDGISAWLHLLRARLKHAGDSCGPELRELPISSRYTVNSSFEFFKIAENMGLTVYPEEPFTIQDQSDVLYHILDTLIEHQSAAIKKQSRASREYLSGWAFRDLVMEKQQFEPYTITLPETGRSWIDFIRAVPVSALTLFGRSFGELIGSNGPCKTWAKLPAGYFFLATSGQVLNRIIADVGYSPNHPRMLVQDKVIWHNPTDPCTCGNKPECEHANNIQVLLPADMSKEMNQQFPSNKPDDNSAFIFGFNPESSWHWPKFGDPTKVTFSSLPENFENSNFIDDSGIGSESGTSRSPSTSSNVYTVGILCALPREGAAMKIMFDEVHDERDNYILGSIGNHHVVLAHQPLEYGNIQASITASALKNDFPTLKFGLLVGIAGGVPSATTDIRLGDVAISVPQDIHPGVIQLGRGKDLEGSEFRRTGSLNKPPQVLLNAIAPLTANPQDCSSKLNKLVKSVTSTLPKYRYPGRKYDILKSAPCARCPDTCSDRENHIPNRERRNPKHPVVHCGVIGSGDTVIKDSVKRNELAKKYGIICVEMEAAGVMQSGLPFLVIRGISDYADSEKNDLWHDYASLTAAAFAKMLLYQVTGENITSQRNPTGLKRHYSECDSHSRNGKRRL